MANQKRIFIRNAAGFLSVFLLIYISIAVSVELFPLDLLSRNYPLWKSQFDFSGSAGEDPSIIFLGDSSCLFAASPSEISVSSRNLCIAGGTPVESYFLLERYLDNHERPDTIVLSFFRFDNSKYFWNLVKYDCVGKDAFSDIYLDIDKHPDAEFGNFWMRYYLYRTNFLPYYSDEINKNLFLKGGLHRSIMEKMEESGGQITLFDSSMDEAKMKRGLENEGMDVFETSDLPAAYFERILSLAANKDIPVIYHHPPLPKQRYEVVGQAYYGDYESFVKPKVLTFDGNHYIDGLFFLEARHFSDTQHVNHQGALAFSGMLDEELQGLLSLSLQSGN